MLCISRITDPSHARHFGDGVHKFYLEMRCPQPALPNQRICQKCTKIYAECKNQFCGLYDHGKVNEPVPDRSHMYGGKWYLEKVKEWGEPPREILALAIQYQENARQGVEIKELEPSISIEMSAAEPKKKGRAKAVTEDLKPATAEDLKPSKRKTKKPAEESQVDAQVDAQAEPKAEPKIAKPKVAKPKMAKPKVSPKQTTSETSNHKEVAIPTHMEKSMEEFDTDGFEFEYVTLTPFEVNETNYFRDRKKEKLYKNIKGAIGYYVGRWDPDTESIHTEVPDSDEEDE
jgi:hypothetical protein